MIPNLEGFIVRRLRTLDEVTGRWSFFAEGLQELNYISPTQRKIEPVTLMNVICEAMSSDEHGLVFVLESKNEKPLVWSVVLDTSSKFYAPSATVYAAYSNGKSRTASRFALTYCEEWARVAGFKELHACSPRFASKAFHLFEKRWGFQRRSILFVKPL
jgi:hypothetical protein